MGRPSGDEATVQHIAMADTEAAWAPTVSVAVRWHDGASLSACGLASSSDATQLSYMHMLCEMLEQQL